MALTIINTGAGEIHVHAAGCRDITRARYQHIGAKWDLTADSERAVVLDIYEGFEDLAEDGSNWHDFAGDVRFFPCCDTLPVEPEPCWTAPGADGISVRLGGAEQVITVLWTDNTVTRSTIADLCCLLQHEAAEDPTHAATIAAACVDQGDSHGDDRGWASPEATAAARADLERRASRHEKRGELDYAADVRMQADELTATVISQRQMDGATVVEVRHGSPPRCVAVGAYLPAADRAAVALPDAQPTR
jgi:hypothetical protein